MVFKRPTPSHHVEHPSPLLPATGCELALGLDQHLPFSSDSQRWPSLLQPPPLRAGTWQIISWAPFYQWIPSALGTVVRMPSLRDHLEFQAPPPQSNCRRRVRGRAQALARGTGQEALGEAGLSPQFTAMDTEATCLGDACPGPHGYDVEEQGPDSERVVSLATTVVRH